MRRFERPPTRPYDERMTNRPSWPDAAPALITMLPSTANVAIRYRTNPQTPNPMSINHFRASCSLRYLIPTQISRAKNGYDDHEIKKLCLASTSRPRYEVAATDVRK